MGPFLNLALSLVRNSLQTLFRQRTINFIFPACVRWGQILIHCEVGLVEYRAHFRARVEALFTMVVPHPTATDASERQVML